MIIGLGWEVGCGTPEIRLLTTTLWKGCNCLSVQQKYLLCEIILLLSSVWKTKWIPWVVCMVSLQFSSVAQSCPTLCDPMNRSTPGLPVHHQLPEFTQTHVHRVSDAIQPSHPIVPFSSCPQSLPASESFPMSQLFAWGGQSTGVSALCLACCKGLAEDSRCNCGLHLLTRNSG